MATHADRSESTWHEWVITSALVVLSLGAVWAVFGDDLAQLVSPEASKDAHRPSSTVPKLP